MNSKFLKYYKQIILQEAESNKNNAEIKKQEKISQPINMRDKFDAAKKEAETTIENCTDKIASAAFHQIANAYKNNPALFDTIQTKKDEQTKSDNTVTAPTQQKTTQTTTANPNTKKTESDKKSNSANTSTNNNVKVTHIDQNGKVSGIKTSGSR